MIIAEVKVSDMTDVFIQVSYLTARATCSLTRRSMFPSHFSSKPRSVNLSADFLALRRMASVSCLPNESALR